MTTPKSVVPPIDVQISEALQVYAGLHHELDIFLSGVDRWFSSHPLLTTGNPPLVHSVKARLKDPTHLAEKLRRKYVRDNQLCFPPAELGLHITDLAGLRVMHLHQLQFANIHKAIMKKVGDADWHLMEPVKAYTWDPESRTYFESLELECQVKESFYTSVHYVLRPRQDSQIACEVQVRTLFEEIWGEVDHSLNYPTATDSLSCKEQLRVLAKLVGAGSRLVESIFRTVEADPIVHEAVAAVAIQSIPTNKGEPSDLDGLGASTLAIE